MIGSGASTVRSRHGTANCVPLFQNWFVPMATAVANAATFRKIDTMAQVEIWIEQREGRFSSGELVQCCTTLGVKGCSAAGETTEGGERCSRAALASVCGCTDRGALLACA
eukprot:2299456-Pleurochrysis_carterae.AAC.1